jgi:hypothetical protein
LPDRHALGVDRHEGQPPDFEVPAGVDDRDVLDRREDDGASSAP